MEKQEDLRLEKDVKLALLRVGLRCDFVGFNFLCEAINLVVRRPDLARKLCKGVYQQIAQKFAVKTACVERSIRHAIDNTFVNKNFTELNKMFKMELYTIHDKPTAGELINLLAQYFTLGLNE